ncbi:MAG: hypothetical protein ACON5B_14025, partial [Myxococcota bacterium]
TCFLFVPPCLSVCDQNTQLSEAQVDSYVSNNGYATTSQLFSGNYNALYNRPSSWDIIQGLDDCAPGDILIRAFDGTWLCAPLSSYTSSGTVDGGGGGDPYEPPLFPDYPIIP